MSEYSKVKYEHETRLERSLVVTKFLNAIPNASKSISMSIDRLDYSMSLNLRHTLRGMGPGDRLNVSYRSGCQFSFGNANSNLCTTLASNTVCSTVELVRNF